jgi:hypothetical protein
MKCNTDQSKIFVRQIMFYFVVIWLGTYHLTWRGGGYGFLFLFFFFGTTTRVRIFILFPECNIRLYDKHSESLYFFSSTKIRIFFSATLGFRIFFLNHNSALYRYIIQYVYVVIHAEIIREGGWGNFCI